MSSQYAPKLDVLLISLIFDNKIGCCLIEKIEFSTYIIGIHLTEKEDFPIEESNYVTKMEWYLCLPEIVLYLNILDLISVLEQTKLIQ